MVLKRMIKHLEMKIDSNNSNKYLVGRIQTFNKTTIFFKIDDLFF